MLSRTAAHLFWMARYIERAENLTRLMRVAQTFALMPVSKGGKIELSAPLAISGSAQKFKSIYGDDISLPNICKFFAYDEKNEGSIARCITNARENAHAVRGTITPDIWESLNETYILINSMINEGLDESDYETFFDKVLERYQMYYGAFSSTMQRNDSLNFTKLGHMIERADNIARAIQVKYQSSSKTKGAQDNAIEYYQLTSLLRAMSAHEAYHSSYSNAIIPQKVAQLLILSEDLPRSLLFCVGEINDILNKIEGKAGVIAKRLTAELYATLKYSTIDQCMINGLGLDEFLKRFLLRINSIGAAISYSYLEAV
ncbi:MAG: alpha-E domain-containing protein [Succinivibrionaceae bacterium]|nr:alpha-E domain-containing protein [Succinivibrionaceae bacterium]